MVTLLFDCVASMASIFTTVGARIVTLLLALSLAVLVSVSA